MIGRHGTTQIFCLETWEEKGITLTKLSFSLCPWGITALQYHYSLHYSFYQGGWSTISFNFTDILIQYNTTRDIWHVTHNMWHLTYDTHNMWHLTYDTCNVTPDIWHMACDTWHMTRDMWHDICILTWLGQFFKKIYLAIH